jgi:hypothetical protein
MFSMLSVNLLLSICGRKENKLQLSTQATKQNAILIYNKWQYSPTKAYISFIHSEIETSSIN